MDLAEAFSELNLVQDFIPAGNSNRPARRLTATAITIHNTDNTGKGANAAAHAKYLKGADARQRNVSWHFTVDDGAVFQSLPTNEVGFHAGSREGNSTSIGIEICMNQGLDEAAANQRAALLTAVMLHQNQIPLRGGVKQHNHWSGKNCPSVIRAAATGWDDFLAEVSAFHRDLTPAPAVALNLSAARRGVADHHHLAAATSVRRTRTARRRRRRTA